MTSSRIRYRFALLLIGAAMALVVNPVLHAFSHDHVDHPEDSTESVADLQWTEQDLCPYCEAVSQYMEPPVTKVSNMPVVLQRDNDAIVILYADRRLRLSKRLRAPPF